VAKAAANSHGRADRRGSNMDRLPNEGNHELERRFKSLIVREPMNENNRLVTGFPQVLIIPLNGHPTRLNTSTSTRAKALGATLTNGYARCPALAPRGSEIS
jgi:hypothetical protein